MKLIDKIIKFIKSIFSKEKEVKLLEEPMQIQTDAKKEQFLKSLKYNVSKKLKRKNIETLICEDAGLGIQKKISY